MLRHGLHKRVQSQRELIERQAQQIALHTARAEELQTRLSKDSHGSHLPPSSECFQRQPESLCKKSGMKPARACWADAAANMVNNLKVRHNFHTLTHFIITDHFQQKRCMTNFHSFPGIFRSGSGTSHGGSGLIEP